MSQKDLISNILASAQSLVGIITKSGLGLATAARPLKQLRGFTMSPIAGNCTNRSPCRDERWLLRSQPICWSSARSTAAHYPEAPLLSGGSWCSERHLRCVHEECVHQPAKGKRWGRILSRAVLYEVHRKLSDTGYTTFDP